PRSVSDNPAEIGHYALAEYGCWGGFASYEDTSLYRVASENLMRLPDPLLPIPILQAMDRVTTDDTSENRDALYAALRQCMLCFPFTVPESELRLVRQGKAVLSEHTPVIYSGQERNGNLYLFAYTDMAYRVGPTGGTCGFRAAEAYAFILEKYPHAS